jgi:hypothetical protein
MLAKSLLTLTLLLGPITFQSADECKRCDCSTYPQSDDFCTKCCFIQKGVITSKSDGSVTITPSRAEAPPRTFKLSPHIPITGDLKVGEDASVYYHKVDGQDVATRIELTDYIQGQLTPASLPGPSDNGCAKANVPENATRVLFGRSGFVALGYPAVALKVDGVNLITLQRTKRGILVSAKLFNSRGRLAAQIVDNHFFVNVNGALRLENAPDHHSLKIFDGGTLLVDFQFTNPSTLTILGTLFGPLGTHLDVSPDEMRVNGVGQLIGVCGVGANVGFDIGTTPAKPKN